MSRHSSSQFNIFLFMCYSSVSLRYAVSSISVDDTQKKTHSHLYYYSFVGDIEVRSSFAGVLNGLDALLDMLNVS